MHNCLVIGLDSGCMMQDHNFRIEIVHALRVSVLIYQDHAFSELSPLQLDLLINNLNSEADSLSTDRDIDRCAFMMYGFDHYRVELA